jgi:predicted ATP-grasp superfamily ATP-dependent carboligase
MSRPGHSASQPHAVVIGVDSLPGIQTARILAERGVPVIGVAADPRQAFCRTNSCLRMVYADKAGSGLIDALRGLAEDLDHKAVLVPCEDSSVLVLSRNRAAVEDLFHLVLPPADVVELLVDKVRFYEFAAEQGLPIPATFVLRSLQDAERAASELSYPAVLKPAHRTDAWVAYTPAKALKLSSPDELVSQYRGASAHVDVLIAQKWIAGTDTNLYSCNACYGHDGEPLVSFTAKKIRQWPPRTGISSLGEECQQPAVTDMAHQLFQSVPYRGLAYLEVKLDDSDGEYYIVEPNIGRPTGRSAISEGGGVELTYTMYCLAAGLPLPSNRTQQYGGVKWVYLRHDIQSALFYWRHGELTLRGWLASVRGKKVFAVFSLKDPIPFLLDCIHPLRRAFTREGRKSRQYGLPAPQSVDGA